MCFVNCQCVCLRFFLCFREQFSPPLPTPAYDPNITGQLRALHSRYLFAALTNPEYRTQGRLDKED